MKPKEFVSRYLSYARNSEEKSGISAVFILAQAAIESGRGKVAPGNNFFGVKDTDGVNGNEQLLLTTEYSRRADLKFPEVISVTPVILGGQHYFKYRVKDYFRKYSTPEESFDDHALFFLKTHVTVRRWEWPKTRFSLPSGWQKPAMPLIPTMRIH